jgi:hypothetical protein
MRARDNSPPDVANDGVGDRNIMLVLVLIDVGAVTVVGGVGDVTDDPHSVLGL